VIPIRPRDYLLTPWMVQLTPWVDIDHFENHCVRGFDGLSGVSCLKVKGKITRIKLGKSPPIPKEFLQDLGSCDHNFGTRNSRKSIRDSKDTYYSLESKKTLSHNFGSLFGWWRHKRKTKKQNIPQPLRHPLKTQISKTFLSVLTTRLHDSFEGFSSLQA